MNAERVYGDYLEDILDALVKVGQFIAGMTFEQFEKDDKTSFAVIRALEVIGEASKNIPEDIRVNYPEVPWRVMAGMRDKLAHDYFGVYLEVVWRTATEDLPGLDPIIRRILEEVSG
jgi:uncharacterized protein with HEPN domain